MWKLIIIVSAITGFGANIEGGVAIRVVDGFVSERGCEQASNKVRAAAGTKPAHVTAVCVEIR
jgi:hypothetical protein